MTGNLKEKSVSAADTGTLGKAMALVALVADAAEPLRFTDILNASDHPRGTLHRQLKHLVEEGLLETNGDGAYVPGLRLLRFAARAWSRNEFRQLAAPHLQVLHDATGETVHLALLRGAEVIYLDKVEARQAVRMHSLIGNASPAYCTGVGKAALAMLADEDVRARLEAVQFERFTETTHADLSSLVADLGKIRQRGFAYDLEEHQPGIRCVAASIHVPEQNILAGVSVTAPAYRIGDGMLDLWSGPLLVAAEAIMRDVQAGLAPRR
ncbi:DNA-binding IclR family transcriptional regulator [Neorhizobium huautlense]|uniref:DNA-binding IclR family transcriptional regulator n=1 Tax=Neorhizobium huautlense TaxID=67774 RepID=A0ABT9PN54_9HYPH|nr:IclR family transcriptional regulator [Neorhizobium huautlense]MDP9835324.1 DNA-binding IclR family transcriptional regulator [Neorhizobium huautlense]